MKTTQKSVESLNNRSAWNPWGTFTRLVAIFKGLVSDVQSIERRIKSAEDELTGVKNELKKLKGGK